MQKVYISERRWLLLPVETVARELAGKMLLASIAAEEGWGVVIGKRDIVRDKQGLFPRGTFIEKSISPGRIKEIEAAKRYGNRVSAWCEEGLIYMNQKDYGHRRLEKQSFDKLDFFFAWGKKHAKDVSELMGNENKTVITGNPRFDLLRPELRDVFLAKANKLSERYGNFILVNTKFPSVNFNTQKDDFDLIKNMHIRGKIKNQEQEILWNRYIDFHKNLYAYFQNMLENLSKRFNEHKIILRPHPSENHAPWIEIAKRLNNVEVIFEGNVSEWLLAADVMIHNNCTTGVESFLLGKPAISYQPIYDSLIEHELPSELSYKVNTEQELFNLVERVINNEVEHKHYIQKRELFAKEYIANVDEKLASENILEYLNEIDLKDSSAHFPVKENITIKITNLLKDIKMTLKSPSRVAKYFVKHDAYDFQKFPGLSIAEMRDVLTSFVKATGRFSDLEVIQIYKNTFCIYKP